MRRAVFAGTFDPFTNGHLDIIKKASLLFDEVIILFADNNKKQRLFNKDDMMNSVTEMLRRDGYDNVSVDTYSGLTVDYCLQHEVGYLVRGLRNVTDFLYEEELASANSILDERIETVYIRGRSSAISSSIVREMIANKRGYAYFVPHEVYELIVKSSY